MKTISPYVLIGVLVLTAAPAWAQQTAPPAPALTEPTTRIVPVKHLPAAEVAKVAAPLLLGGDATLIAEPVSNRLLFRGDEQSWSRLQELVLELDQPSKPILVELTIATLNSGETPLDWSKSGEELTERVSQLEKEQKLQGVERLKLLGLDSQPVKFQRGGSQPYVQSTVQGIPGGRGQTRSVSYEQVGSLIEFTAAARGPGIVMLELTIERSESQAGEPLSDAESAPPPPVRTVSTLATTAQVPEGTTILIAGSEKEGRQMLVLLRASVVAE